MRLLDPFAGVKMATGHMLFHFSFFIGSYIVEFYDGVENWCTHDCEDIIESTVMQRKSAKIPVMIFFRHYLRILSLALGPSRGLCPWNDILRSQHELIYQR